MKTVITIGTHEWKQTVPIVAQKNLGICRKPREILRPAPTISA